MVGKGVLKPPPSRFSTNNVACPAFSAVKRKFPSADGAGAFPALAAGVNPRSVGLFRSGAGRTCAFRGRWPRGPGERTTVARAQQGLCGPGGEPAEAGARVRFSHRRSPSWSRVLLGALR